MQTQKQTEAGERTRKLVLNGPHNKLVLILDQREVFPDNPGMGTPALVVLYGAHGRELGTATYACACGEGEVDGYSLQQNQADWLYAQEQVVDQFLYS